MSVSVRANALGVAIGGTRILHDVSFDVQPGEFVTILGPSGSGKTTVLNALAGFGTIVSGSIHIGDVDVTHASPQDRAVGIVFQKYALFPHMTVEGNVSYPLRLRRVGPQDRRRRVSEALDLVGLAGFGGRRISSLSGGQQQRVALARALVYEPRMLLLDEPLSALDKQLREMMQGELKRIQREVGVTTIAVTHDQSEALAMSTKVVVMRDGRIVQIGSPADLYEHPDSRFVAEFLGETNLVDLGSADHPLVAALTTARRVDGRGLAVVRPEHVAVQASGTDGVEAHVVDADYHGSRVRVVCSAGRMDQQVIAYVDPVGADLQFAPGAAVRLTLRADADLHVISEGLAATAPEDSPSELIQ